MVVLRKPSTAVSLKFNKIWTTINGAIPPPSVYVVQTEGFFDENIKTRFRKICRYNK